jgi:cytochrome c peroxidase
MSRRAEVFAIRRIGFIAAAVLVTTSCEPTKGFTPPPNPGQLDQELRAQLGFWGATEIGAVAAQDPALVDLGRSLFFDKILSGNRDVSCATCHEPDAQMMDGQALAIGTGGAGRAPSRSLGAGREFVPRNAPTLLNMGLGLFYTLWDGRVNEEFTPGQFKAPTGVALPSGLKSLVAAQAMFPILNRAEMRGKPGDVDVNGNPNEFAAVSDANPNGVWQAAMTRLLAVQEYVAKFNAAYPGLPTSQLGFQHAANAIAAFEIEKFTKKNSPFDRYLARDNSALTDEQKRGALLFFGKGACSTCHQGALLGGRQFSNIGIPQIGPGVGAAAPLDIGRAEHMPVGSQPFYRFTFRVPTLRNVELTAPYMHNGAFKTLETVVRHYTNPDSSLRNYDVTQLDPALRTMVRNDPATIADVLKNLDQRFKFAPIKLNEEERAQIVAFLKALTDPAAKNLASVVPATVPSGLSVRD